MGALEKLNRIQKANSTLLCVGLDPDVQKMPDPIGKTPDKIFEFNKTLIDATEDLVCGYKLNFAFYEQYGRPGIKALEKTISHIPFKHFLIADAKRGDIGNSSKAYAKACFSQGADAVTISPYMGRDSVLPFLETDEKMTFLLALTSNPGSEDFQKLNVDGRPLYEHVVEKSMLWASPSRLGFVVGATHPGELEAIRKKAPENAFLIPGIGTQGGDLVATLKANAGGPCLINVSRSIIYASRGVDFTERAREKAELYREAIRNSLENAK